MTREELVEAAVADTVYRDTSKYMAGKAVAKDVQDAAHVGESGEDVTGEVAEYVFMVDGWQKREHTIGVQEFGVASVASMNLFLLEHSTAYPELHLKSEVEYRFYSERKKRVEGVQFSEENVSGFEFEGKKVVFADGQITVLKGKDVAGSPVAIAEFERTPNALFRKMMGYL